MNISEKTEKKFFKNFFTQDFFQSAIVQWSLIGSILLNATCWSVLAYFIRPVDFPIVLHYNIYFGVDIIGPWWQAYYFSMIGVGILLLNSGLGYFFYKQTERVVAHLLLLGAFICELAILIAVTSIILMNY